MGALQKATRIDHFRSCDRGAVARTLLRRFLARPRADRPGSPIRMTAIAIRPATQPGRCAPGRAIKRAN